MKKVVDGNRAAAYGALLCRPEVIAIYPITPQSQIAEQLSTFQAQGRLHAEIVVVEGEHSAMGVLIGASMAGGRTFTATSSQGLFFMYEPCINAANSRLPIVMAIPSREQEMVTGSLQDVFNVKDMGWIQLHAERCQEILDSIIMAYRLAEDPEILLPVCVCYEGFYLSHLSEAIEIPSQEEVDRFLTPISKGTRVKVGLEEPPLCFYPYILGKLLVEYRYKHCAALERAKDKFEQIDTEFGAIFGRSYGGPIEEYRTEDAEIVLVTSGSYTGTARAVVNKKRDEGMKIGLIKIRMIRPFPRERVAKALRGKKAIGIIDRSVCFGWNCGHLFIELQPALRGLEASLPVMNFIDGLNNLDITIEHIEKVADIVYEASQGKPYKEVTWVPLEFD